MRRNLCFIWRRDGGIRGGVPVGILGVIELWQLLGLFMDICLISESVEFARTPANFGWGNLCASARRFLKTLSPIALKW